MSSINRIYIIAAVLGSLLLTIPAYAQYGYGTSSISLNSTSISTNAGQQVNVQYTVNLVSGQTWGTSISVSNAGNLSSQGISVTFTNPSGDPPFSGVAAIKTSPTTAPGSYQIQFVATGDDPSSSSTAYMLTVPASTTFGSTTLPQGSGTNTTGTNSTGKNTTGTNSTGRNTTITPTYTTSVSYSSNTSIPSNYGQSGTALDVSILAVIVLFLVIILALKFA